MTDGGARIEYDDPAASFVVERRYEGESATDDQLRTGPDLSTDVPAVFVAPVDDDGFVYHVFANDAFADHADWHVVWLAGEGLPDDAGAATFEGATDDVSHLGAVPEADVDGIGIADATALEIDETDEADVTGLAVHLRDDLDHAGSGPPVAAFDVDRSGDTLTITHMGVDAFPAESVALRSDTGDLDADFGEGEVTAGDTATVNLGAHPDVSTVRVVWADGDDSAVLVSYDVE